MYRTNVNIDSKQRFDGLATFDTDGAEHTSRMRSGNADLAYNVCEVSCDIFDSFDLTAVFYVFMYKCCCHLANATFKCSVVMRPPSEYKQK